MYFKKAIKGDQRVRHFVVKQKFEEKKRKREANGQGPSFFLCKLDLKTLDSCSLNARRLLKLTFFRKRKQRKDHALFNSS
jgi:hypothetical protein